MTFTTKCQWTQSEENFCTVLPLHIPCALYSALTLLVTGELCSHSGHCYSSCLFCLLRQQFLCFSWVIHQRQTYHNFSLQIRKSYRSWVPISFTSFFFFLVHLKKVDLLPVSLCLEPPSVLQEPMPYHPNCSFPFPENESWMAARVLA